MRVAARKEVEMVAFGSRSLQHGRRTTAGRSALADDGFATGSVVSPLPALEEALAVLPSDPGDDDPPSDHPWLDDPAYEVGAFLLGLRESDGQEPPSR
jgi:hypothetical protein